jgi:hypothetical protein
VFGHHGPAEKIGGAEACRRAAERGNCVVPLAPLSPKVCKVDCGEHLESFVDAGLVLRLDSRKAFHVRLTESEIHMKVRIRATGLGTAKGVVRCGETHGTGCGSDQKIATAVFHFSWCGSFRRKSAQCRLTTGD